MGSGKSWTCVQPPGEIKEEIPVMAPRTVQQLFGLKPEELNALTVLSGLEGFRGGKGQDVAAVAANVLARRLQGGWGGVDIRNIAKSPGQYEAVFDYSMQQLADPAFGARVLGGQAEFDRLRNIVNNPALVGEQFTKSKGAQSFRGVAAYDARKPGDYTPIYGQSNFYFNPLDQATYKKGAGIFGSPGPTAQTAAVQTAAAPSANLSPEALTAALRQRRQQKTTSLLDTFKQQAVQGLIQNLSVINPFGFLQ
jgi:hypothetical protein